MTEPADSTSTHRVVRRAPPLSQHRLWQLSLVRALLLGTVDRHRGQPTPFDAGLLGPLDQAVLNKILGLMLLHWEPEVRSLPLSAARAAADMCCRPT